MDSKENSRIFDNPVGRPDFNNLGFNTVMFRAVPCRSVPKIIRADYFRAVPCQEKYVPIMSASCRAEKSMPKIPGSEILGPGSRVPCRAVPAPCQKFPWRAMPVHFPVPVSHSVPKMSCHGVLRESLPKP